MSIFILDAAEDQCRFPLWGDDESIGDVCGAATAKGESYCAACRRLAYAPNPPRSVAAPGADRVRATEDREPDLVEIFR